MGRFLSQSRADLRPLKKQQVFTVSGMFTPSEALLEAGGVVTVRCVGGGGGGGAGYSKSTTGRSGGGSSGADITRIVTVTGPVEVIIGAGGNGGYETNHSNSRLPPSAGGATTFGDLLTAPGGQPPPLFSYSGSPGGSVGEGSAPGQPAQRVPEKWTAPGMLSGVSLHAHSPGAGGGCGGGHHVDASKRFHAPPNTGGGGSATESSSFPIYGGNGGSGLCIVTWEE